MVTATITVNSLGGLGDGIAELNGKPVFIPKSCAGDVLDIRIVKEIRENIRAEIVRVISPGPDRGQPFCDYFAECGGCALQQLSDAAYRDFRKRVLHSSLNQAGFDAGDAEVIFLPRASRRRVEFTVSHIGGKPALAFNRKRTNDPVAIAVCPVLEPELQALMVPLAEALAGFSDAASMKMLSLTNADTGIDMLIEFSAIPGDDAAQALAALAEKLGLARTSILLPGGAIKTIAERKAITMRFGNYNIPLPPNAFLQATREGQRILTETALSGIEGATSAVDLFCGLGTYSFPASQNAKVHAVEGDAAMVAALQKFCAGLIPSPLRGGNLTAQCRDLFRHPLTAFELKRFDAAIVNPPRLGAKAQCEQLAASGIGRIVMISCNPATFARDAKILGKAGFSLKKAIAVDQFAYSPHLEIAAILSR